MSECKCSQKPEMSLRDYFAGLAMQALLIAMGNREANPAMQILEEVYVLSEIHGEIPASAYAVADAMLKAREKAANA